LQIRTHLQPFPAARRYFQGSTSKQRKKRVAKKISKKTPTPKATTSKATSEGQQPVSDDEVIADDIEAEMDELDPSEDETPPKKKLKKKACDDSPANIEATAYIFIVIPPPPTTQVRNRATKPPPEQHRKRPPFMFNIEITYEDFVRKVASATPCYPQALTGMMWKFEKPIKGDTKPLTTEISYTAMIKQLRDKMKDHIINIYMPPPNKLDDKPIFVCISLSVSDVDQSLV